MAVALCDFCYQKTSGLFNGCRGCKLKVSRSRLFWLVCQLCLQFKVLLFKRKTGDQVGNLISK